MVLPASPADDPLRPETGWIEAIQRTLRLGGDNGVLVHVDHAGPERLGELARALFAEWPDLDVLDGVAGLETAPEGATRVVVPRVEEALWLNLNRPIVTRRRLKIVLWCDHATTVELSRKAPDFFDWISAHVECPKGLVPFALAGVRGALQAKAPGIHWTGGVDEAAKVAVAELLQVCAPGVEVRWVEVEGAYENVIESVKSVGGEGVWVGTVADAQWKVWRFRWACAEAKSTCPEVVLAPGLECPGFWPVHDRTMTFAEARERLAKAWAVRGQLLAALLQFEPEAVELSAELLWVSVPEEGIRSLVTSVADPGAALAAWASQDGRLPVADPRGALAARAMGRSPASAHVGVLVEASLRADVAVPSWIAHSLVAEKLGDEGVSTAWRVRAPAAEPSMGRDATAITLERVRDRLGGAPKKQGLSLKNLIDLTKESFIQQRLWDEVYAGTLVREEELHGIGDAKFVGRVLLLAQLLVATGTPQIATRLLRKILGTNEPGELEISLLRADEAAKLRPVLERFLAAPSPEITPETAALAREALVRALRAQGRFEEAALLTSDLPPEPPAPPSAPPSTRP